MKRFGVVGATLCLVAAMFSPGLAAAATSSSTRVAPRVVTLHSHRRHLAGNKILFSLSGRVVLPSSVSSSACHGRVLLRIRHGNRTLSARFVQLRSSCRYSESVTIANSRLRGSGSTRAYADFEGNGTVKPRSAHPTTA